MAAAVAIATVRLVVVRMVNLRSRDVTQVFMWLLAPDKTTHGGDTIA